MRRIYLLIAVLAIACLAGAVLFAHPTSTGTVTGKVTFTGTTPKMKPIDMSKEPSCAKLHSTPATSENVVTGPGNSLEWVVVYVSAGDQGSVPPTQKAKIDQKGCVYLPHVLAIQVGQTVEITNDDSTSHNIHAMAKANQEWNKSQTAGSTPIESKYDKPEFIALKCNVHPWMHGYLAVLSTSHFAVSGPDGSFTIKDLPPGKYTLTAWQEQYGTQTQEITVGGGTTSVNFVYKATPY